MKFYVYECFNGDGYIIRIDIFGDGSGNDLVDKGMVVDRFGIEDLCLEVNVVLFNEVLSLMFVYLVFVGDIDEFVVIEVFGISNIGEIRILFFVVFVDNRGVVKVVFFEEFFGVVVWVDRDFGDGVVNCVVGRILFNFVVELR